MRTPSQPSLRALLAACVCRALLRAVQACAERTYSHSIQLHSHSRSQGHRQSNKKQKTKATAATTTTWDGSIALTISQSKSTPNPFCMPKWWDPPICDLTARPCAVEKMFSHSRKIVTTCRWAHSQHASTACPSSRHAHHPPSLLFGSDRIVRLLALPARGQTGHVYCLYS